MQKTPTVIGPKAKYWRWSKNAGEFIPKWPPVGCAAGPDRRVAWRILDAQFFGVAQRRRRAFVVASPRNDIDPSKILFEFKGVRRDSPPSRETKSATSALTATGVGVSGADDNQAQAGHLITGHRMVAFGGYAMDETASRMKARDYKDATDLVTYGIPGNWIGRAPENGGNATTPMDNIAPCLTGADRHGVAVIHGTQDPCHQSEVSFALGRNNGGENVVFPAVRRLTPTECERLQGFPDGHTNIPGAADGNRYRALGNSKAVPVVQWIGKRIIKHLKGEI